MCCAMYFVCNSCVVRCAPVPIGCSEYTIIPAKYAYLLTTDITDGQAAMLERKNKCCILHRLIMELYSLTGHPLSLAWFERNL